MKSSFTISLFFTLLLTVVFKYATAQLNEVHNEWRAYFDKLNVKGSCVIYDLKKDKYHFYNRPQYTVQFTPASTFKILNSLVALQVHAVPNENYVLQWDGKDRGNEAWNKDTDMKTAFKNSTVWFYQELARRAGEKLMKHYVEKSKYGNEKISGGIDQFWLNGELRISPQQQIEFLVKLYKNKLPFSRHNLEIVKNIMIQEDTMGYVLRGKTGWGTDMNRNIGWYVGYITKGNEVYFFATCIQDDAIENKNFSKSRTVITRQILRDLKVLPPKE